MSVFLSAVSLETLGFSISFSFGSLICCLATSMAVRNVPNKVLKLLSHSVASSSGSPTARMSRRASVVEEAEPTTAAAFELEGSIGTRNASKVNGIDSPLFEKISSNLHAASQLHQGRHSEDVAGESALLAPSLPPLTLTLALACYCHGIGPSSARTTTQAAAFGSIQQIIAVDAPEDSDSFDTLIPKGIPPRIKNTASASLPLVKVGPEEQAGDSQRIAAGRGSVTDEASISRPKLSTLPESEIHEEELTFDVGMSQAISHKRSSQSSSHHSSSRRSSSQRSSSNYNSSSRLSQLRAAGGSNSQPSPEEDQPQRKERSKPRINKSTDLLIWHEVIIKTMSHPDDGRCEALMKLVLKFSTYSTQLAWGSRLSHCPHLIFLH